MAFLQHLQRVSRGHSVKALSTSATSILGPQSTHNQESKQKAVFISQSNDVFTNLALEEWLHKNTDCSNLHLMLCYKNDPCVVLGKNGNPWLDVQHHDDGIAVARRSNDSGTEYHDQGLMNFTFFGQDVPEEHNLSLISRAMFRKFGVNVKHNGENLTFYDKQVSQSGSPIETMDNSYQNCTLYVDVDKNNSAQHLAKDKHSASNPLMNFKELAPQATANGLLSAIGWEFMRTKSGTLQDGGLELATQQRGFQMVNPTDKWFPGINAIRDRLVQWDWCFGSTPEFSIFRTFQVPAALLNNPSDSNELRVKLAVDHGKISDISLVVPPGLLSSGYTGEAQIITDIRGQKFSEETLKKIENFLGLEKCHNEREKFVTECVKKAMVI